MFHSYGLVFLRRVFFCLAAILGIGSSSLLAFTASQLEDLAVVSPLPVARNLSVIAASGETVFTVGNGGAAAVSRNGGVTWTKAANFPWEPFSSISGLASNGSIWVGNRFGSAFVSNDLESWTQAPSRCGTLDLIYANGLFMSVGSGGASNVIRTSEDGMSWATPVEFFLALRWGY